MIDEIVDRLGGDRKIVVEWVKYPNYRQNSIIEVFTIHSLLSLAESYGIEIDHVSDLNDLKNLFWADGFSPVNPPIRVCSVKTIHQFKKEIVTEIRKKREIQAAIERIGGDFELIARFGYYDEDNERRVSTTYTKVSTLLADCASYYLDSVKNINTLSDLAGAIQDTGDDVLCFLGTAEDWEKKKLEDRRRELEPLAAEIARRNNIQLNTIEFLEAIQRELEDIRYEHERWNDGETRMEEWAAHMYCGTRDAYWDDLNYVNEGYVNRKNQLHDIMALISSTCPILYAQFEEGKLQKENLDVDSE